MQELRAFASLVDPIHPEKALRGLKVLVSHIKDPLTKDGAFRKEIAERLHQLNDLGIEFLFPIQGQKIKL
jgi:cAMP phosphodiesterase